MSAHPIGFLPCDLHDYLRENLCIEVKKTNEYTGGQFSGSLYANSSTVQLILNGEVISEAYL